MPGDRILQRMPVEWGMSVAEILAPLAAGATLVIGDPSRVKDPGYLIRLITTEHVSVLFLEPEFLHSIADSKALHECTSLRAVICSAEGLTSALAAKWRERTQADLRTAYGATETTAYCVLAGRPAAGSYLLVLDEQLRIAPPGVPGELYVGGSCLARGYASRPGLTAQRFVPDPFNSGQRLWRSGVLARWAADHELDYLGRTDMQIPVHGWRAEPGEVEEVLRRHPGVRDATAICDSGPGYPRLRAFVESAQDDLPMPGELYDHVAAWLPWYAAPADITRVDKLPRAEDGRVDRHALGLMLPELTAGMEIASPLAGKLCALFAQVLKAESVDPGDDFFALGGHSLAAMSLVAKIHETLGADLTVLDVFEAPTAMALADRVSGKAV